jgi:serine/threonine protein phosphatase PrpC
VLRRDGLHDILTHAQILDAAGSQNPREAAEALVKAAKSSGGYDSIRAVVVAAVAK